MLRWEHVSDALWGSLELERAATKVARERCQHSVADRIAEDLLDRLREETTRGVPLRSETQIRPRGHSVCTSVGRTRRMRSGIQRPAGPRGRRPRRPSRPSDEVVDRGGSLREHGVSV